MNDNPFILEPYRSKELFCDREKESSRLIEDVENGRNVTLISPRRLGKTGLILRTFDEIASRKLKIKTVYADISSASNLDDFIRLLSEAVVSVLKENSKISKFFKSLGGIKAADKLQSRHWSAAALNYLAIQRREGHDFEVPVELS
jgi:AAA+ ATPase superfamily predicted ATPase